MAEPTVVNDFWYHIYFFVNQAILSQIYKYLYTLFLLESIRINFF